VPIAASHCTDPNVDPYSTNFGLITGERGHGQRQITFAVKLLF
jgi:hypothetical protein